MSVWNPSWKTLFCNIFNACKNVVCKGHKSCQKWISAEYESKLVLERSISIVLDHISGTAFQASSPFFPLRFSILRQNGKKNQSNLAPWAFIFFNLYRRFLAFFFYFSNKVKVEVELRQVVCFLLHLSICKNSLPDMWTGNK